MGCAALATFVAQTAHDGDVVAVRLEGLDDVRELEIAADLLRLPFVLKRAMRKVDEAQSQASCCSRLGHCRTCRNHRIQQGQGDRGAGAFQQRAAGQVFFRQKHDLLRSTFDLLHNLYFTDATLRSEASRFRKASLETIPRTMESKR